MKGKSSKLLYKAKSLLKQATPTILTCVGTIGVIATAVMTTKATPKAMYILAGHEGIDNDGNPYKYTKKEAIQLTWKCYLPAAAVGLATIACIFGANMLNKKNQASLTSAYAFLNESYKRYKKAANEVYGEDADSKIQAQAAKDTYISGDGYALYCSELDDSEDVLFYDSFSERYFTSTLASVINAEYHFNRNLNLRGDGPLNELYEFMGLEKTEHGDTVGWSMDELVEGGIMWLDFENRYVELESGLECYIISALCDPIIL